MRILVDECVDWRILRDLTDHEAQTVRQLGWEHLDDGDLLSLAATQFDLFLTVDQNLPYQQNISSFEIAVIVLIARTTRLVDLRKLLLSLHKALRNARPGELQIVSWRDAH